MHTFYKNSYFRWAMYLLFSSIWIFWLMGLRVASYDRFIVGDCLTDISGQRPAALVLGAAVYNNNAISPVFADRLDTAVELYEAGLVRKIIISGDHGRPTYDEVNTAKNYLIEKNVSTEDIFLDHAGFNTYNSMYRAQSVFQADSLLIVTQDFHLPRALYIANKLDIDAWGCRADKRFYANIKNMKNRERLAKVKAWLDVNLKVKPRFLGSSFDLEGDGRQTWDKL